MMRQDPEALKFLVQVLKNNCQPIFDNCQFKLSSIIIPIGKADDWFNWIKRNSPAEFKIIQLLC